MPHPSKITTCAVCSSRIPRWAATTEHFEHERLDDTQSRTVCRLCRGLLPYTQWEHLATKPIKARRRRLRFAIQRAWRIIAKAQR